MGKLKKTDAKIVLESDSKPAQNKQKNVPAHNLAAKNIAAVVSSAKNQPKEGGGGDLTSVSSKYELKNWTGKTPSTHLYELCQKRKWEKPKFSCKKRKEGFVCQVVLSKYDKKSSSLKTETYFCAKIGDSESEAKHLAAVFAFHRVNHALQMERVLPPGYREYWLELVEELKLGGKPLPEPFSSVEADEKGKTASAQKKTPPVAAKNAYPSVNMNHASREMLETTLQNIRSEVNPTAGPACSADKLKKELLALGFLPLHVEEALLYRKELSGALQWLCAHLPEPDLPLKFRPQSVLEISAPCGAPEAGISREYKLERLAKYGFRRNLIASVLAQFDHNEHLALRFLILALKYPPHELPSLPAPLPPSSGLHPACQEFHDECVALQSIFESRFSQLSPSSCLVTFPACPSLPKLSLQITDIDPQYPHKMPTFLLLAPSAPRYLLLALTRRLLDEAHASFLGSPMIYSAILWCETNVPLLSTNPPPLTEIASSQSHSLPLEASCSPSERASFNASLLGRHQPTRFKDPHKVMKHPPPQNPTNFIHQHYSRIANTPQYRSILDSRSQLPVWSCKDAILQNIEQNPVVIISGETGSGKSTQIPQLILEQVYERNHRKSNVSLFVTQPRRLAASGLAARVSVEAGCSLGELVGYVVQLDSRISPSTCLTFGTTGILLRKMLGDPLLTQYSHLIIDEVHERSIDSDFLLLLLKDLLKKRPDLKIILMSATVNSQLFSRYFHQAPLCSIPGRLFPVQEFFLHDIFHFLKHSNAPQTSAETDEPEFCDPNLASHETSAASSCKERSNHSIPYQTIADLVHYICANHHHDIGPQKQSTILIFLPGMWEIQRCKDALQNSDRLRNGFPLCIFPLHSSISLHEQQKIFASAPPNSRKVILSTNLAETSITVPDVIHVIDCGRVKVTRFEAEKRMECLVEAWISKASGKQRLGRAGRTRAGFCYRVYSRKIWESFDEFSTPEILCLPLERLCLQFLSIANMSPSKTSSKTSSHPLEMLQHCITPPSQEAIHSARQTLTEIGALDSAGNLTALGAHIARIPVDVKLSKCILFGALLGCLDPVLTIAACLAYKSPFENRPPNSRVGVDEKEARRIFREGAGKSDHITYFRAFETWQTKRQHFTKRHQEEEFCRLHFLSLPTLNTLQELKGQYLNALVDLGFVPREYLKLFKSPSKRAEFSAHPLNSNSSVVKNIKAALCAGLYPNLARIVKPTSNFVPTENGALLQDSDAKKFRFYTKSGLQIYRHASSVVFAENKFEEDYLLFSSLITTSRPFIRDLTMISPYPLLLFCASLEVDLHRETIRFDGWLTFHIQSRLAILIQEFRKELNFLLEKMLQNPGLNLAENHVVKIASQLLSNDGFGHFIEDSK